MKKIKGIFLALVFLTIFLLVVKSLSLYTALFALIVKTAFMYKTKIVLPLLSFFLLSFSVSVFFFFKKINSFIILFFWFFFFSGLIIYLLRPNTFMAINQEGEIIETLQFFVVLLSSFFSFFLALIHKKNNQKFFFILYLLGGIALFLVAGDEISWGQRLLNYQTPEAILDYTDQQNEVSWHNSKDVAKHLGDLYVLISSYGSFSFLVYELVKKVKRKFEPVIRHFMVLMPASLFFMAKLLYDVLDNVLGIDLPFSFHSWSEYMELSMYLGIFIQLFLIYYRQVKKKENYGKN